MKPLWGIDLGGTKIEGVILKSADNPEVLLRKRIPTEQAQGYAHIISRIKLLIEMMAEESGLSAEKIGIGTPGTVDPLSGLHKNSNTTCLNGNRFHEDLQKALNLPVVMANDANCFALAEARMGVVKQEMPEAKVVFGVIMGTGVGGGIVVNGKVLTGRQGISGEWGHNFLDESGGVAYTGRKGVVETILSGPALESFYYSLTQEKKSLKEIYQLYQLGKDEAAQKTMQRLTHFFGLGISVVINLLDPDAIVLGGGVGNIDLLYTEGVVSARQFVFNNRLDTRFFRPALGDSAGVFGAAILAE
ncbi:ROK family protein [Catalinimonas niigatensis]|uniref:ROK family protein n=1 Tax=Catalinimonas niigatensis TaxID=1397264 RepID=UPI0026663731|nr:ROK family protein [Catalinimonas niigatensis]WPP51222.1 ROK family protein [Catalinimonas niigatensis]